MVSEEVFDLLYRVWFTTAEVGPDEIDDVGPSAEGWVDGSGAFVRSLRTVVEFGDDEALVGVVVLLVLCICGWMSSV